MPRYTYSHPKTDERIDVIQSMSEKHTYVDDKGVEWNRVWENAPQASFIGKIDPFNKKQFMDVTRDMKGGTVGDLWDISQELSDKRTDKAGKDLIKEQTIKDYKKKTGKGHPHDKKDTITMDLTGKIY